MTNVKISKDHASYGGCRGTVIQSAEATGLLGEWYRVYLPPQDTPSGVLRHGTSWHFQKRHISEDK